MQSWNRELRHFTGIGINYTVTVSLATVLTVKQYDINEWLHNMLILQSVTCIKKMWAEYMKIYVLLFKKKMHLIQW